MEAFAKLGQPYECAIKALQDPACQTTLAKDWQDLYVYLLKLVSMTQTTEEMNNIMFLAEHAWYLWKIKSHNAEIAQVKGYGWHAKTKIGGSTIIARGSTVANALLELDRLVADHKKEPQW